MTIALPDRRRPAFQTLVLRGSYEPNSVLTYEQLKLFYEIALPEVFNVEIVPPDKRLMAHLACREAEGGQGAMRALRAGISDVLVPLARASQGKLERLSTLLTAAGAPSLSLVRAWSAKKSESIMQKGSIATDGEFEIMKAFLDHPGLDEHERDKIQAFVDRYEFGK